MTQFSKKKKEKEKDKGTTLPFTEHVSSMSRYQKSSPKAKTKQSIRGTKPDPKLLKLSSLRSSKRQTMQERVQFTVDYDH